MHFQLKVHIKNNAPEIINFQVNNKTPLIIQHSNQEVLFELFDKETQLAPQKLVMKRDGNNLHIFIDDNDQVDVIIIDYYAYEPLSPVVGLAEDGRLYAYLAESNLASDSIPYLAENVLASQVLSGTGVTLGSAPFNWTPFLYALGGLMGAGLAAAALGGGDGGNATTPPAINVRHSEASGKKNGGIEVETTKGVKSYEIEFVPTNGGKPISIRFEAEGDTFKLTEESKAKLPAGANVPEVVKAGEPIKLLGDLIRDGSAVKVTAVDNNGVTNSTTIDAPFDNNIEKLELGKIEVLNTRPSAVKLPIDTDVGSKVSVLDKAGNIVAGSLPVDSKGHKTLEFLLDPNDPNRNELTDFTVVVEKPGANPASSKLADLPAEKLPTNPVNVDPVELSQPTITPSTESEAGKKFDVNLGDKKDNVEAINVFVTDSKTNKTAVEKIEKNEQGKFTAPTYPNSKIKEVVDNGDGTVTVVLKDDVPKDSKVSVATENANSQSKPSEPLKVTDTGVEAVDTIAEQPEPTSKPSLVADSIKSINQGESTPTNPEAVEFKLNNVSPNATLIPTLVKADGTRIPLPTVKADVNGVVRLADTKEADIQAGDKIELVAQDPNKGASETLEITVPAVNDHRFDSLPPVEPKIETPTTPGEGGATVDASGIKVGETLAINVVKSEPAPNGTPATLEFTKQEDGSLKPADSNPQDVTATVNGDKVTINEASLKDNSPISAAITDPAGNSTEAEPKTVGYDNPTERTISLDKLSLEDKDPVANHQAERIKGEVNGVKAGDTLHFEDDQGNKLPSVKVPDNHEEGKPFAFDIPSNNDNKNPTSIKVSVQEEGKAPTEPVSGNIDPNSLTHTDNQAPPAASIAQNDEKLSVAFDPTQTDELSLINQDTGKPIVSFTKDPETGVFKSDNPQVPDIPAGSNIADIPRTALPKDAVNVVAKTSDIAGKSEESVATPIKPLIEAQTAAPQNVSVKAIDTTSPKGDSTPELFEVSGTAPEGARLIFTANGKTFVTDPVPEGGQFKFLIPVTALGDQNLRSDEITIQAKKEDERASEPQNLPASVVEKNPESHLGDLYAPDAPQPVASGSNDRKFKVSPDTDSVNVEYTDKSGNPQPAADKQPVVTRNEQGELVSNDPNITVSKDTEGNEYITVSSGATKPNSDIRLVAKDIAGRESDPTVVAASSETAEVVADNNPPVDAGENGENGENGSSSDDNQPNASQAPAKPTLTLGGKEKGGAVGDVLVDFPENAQLGDQVVLKYKPVEAGKTADQTETKQLVFKKGENGWEIDPAATTVDTGGLPAVDTQSGKPKFTLPGDKVRDNTTVEAYSKSADNTKVTESTFVVTELDGDGAAGTDGSPAVPKTPTPVINNISGVDEDGDGIPDVLRVEGRVEGAPIGTEVAIRNQAGGVVATGKTIDAEGNFVATGGKPTEPEKATTKDDQLTAVAKAPNQKESAASDPKAIEKENIATPAVDHSTPNSTVAPTSEGAIVRLDPNAKEGAKSVVRTQPKDETGQPSGDPKEDTYVFKDGKWQPDPSDNDAPPVTNGNEVNVIAPSNAEISVTNSNSNNPPNSSTTLPVTSGRPAEATQPEVNNVATTNSPKDLAVKTLFDDNNPADGKTDRFVITGTVEGGAEGTELFVYDAEGNKLITSDLKWGENGTFTVTVSESPNKDLEFGRPTPDTLTFVAKDKDKNPSAEASLALATQENKANPEKAFPNDNTAPQQATVTPNVADGGVRVKLPNDAVAGDKLAVKYTPTGEDAEKTVTFIKQPDGSWKTEPADPDFPATIPASETYLTIPESLLKDGSEVTATITDLAGHSVEHSAQAGDDASTGRIVDLTIEGIDLDNPANLSAEKVKIKGKVQGAGADVPVKVTLPNGQEITVNTKDNGEFEIVLVKEGANNPQVEGETAHTVPSLDLGDQLSVQATEAGKKPSETETLTVPAVATSKTGENGTEEPLTQAEKQALHPNDTTNDLSVTLTAATEEGDGSVSLALPADAQVGDQVEVEYIPDNQEADEPKAKLTLTKTENGWQSSEPSVVIDGNNATLPETLLKDGKEVTAKVIDLAGNENPATAPATAGQDELTPKLASIDVVDTNAQADSVVDALVVKGTAEPGSTVSLGKEGNPTALGTLTAGADTNFTALIINPNAENAATDEQIAALKAKLGLPADTPVIKATDANKLAVGDKLTISAQTTDTGNAAQTGTPKEVPALTATSKDHPFDTTPPADVTLAESDTQGAMKVKLPAEAKVGDTLVLDFKKPAEANADPAEPTEAEAEYVKQADGSWNIVGDNPHGLPATIPTVAEGTQQELEIPKDKLADNQPVTAKLVDQAGNSSVKPATMKAPFDEKTSLEDVKLTSKNEAQAGTKDVDPDSLVVEGYTQPGAKVTIVLTKVDGTKVTKEITAPATAEAGRQDGLAKFTHTFKEGEDGVGTDGINTGEGNNVEITAVLENQRAPNSLTKAIPPTRTVFLEVDPTVDVVDKGKLNEAVAGTPTYNKDISDSVIDEVKLTGYIEKDAKLVVEVRDAQGNLVATGTFANTPTNNEKSLGYKEEIPSTHQTDAKTNTNGDKVTAGKFEVVLTREHLQADKSFEKGQTVTVRAENTDSAVSKGDESKTGLTLPALENYSTADHPEDTKVVTELAETNAAATPTEGNKTAFVEFASETSGNDKGKQQATVKLPKESSEVIKAVLEFTKDGTNEKETVTITRDENNHWKLDEKGTALNLLITNADSEGAFPSIRIPHNLLKGNGTEEQRGKVKLTLTDPANQTLKLEKQVPADATTYLKVGKVTPVDKAVNNISDGNPDKVKVEVEAEVGTTVTVTINGKTVTKKIEASDGTAVTGVTDANGETVSNVRKVVIEVNEDSNQPQQFTADTKVNVSATREDEKANSSDNSKTVGSDIEYEGDTQVQGWTSDPINVTYDDQGKAKASVSLPTESDVNSFSVKFNKEGSGEVTVTYTKGDNGTWTSTDAEANGLAASIAPNTSLEIPANVLDGSKNNGQARTISVKATDIAGNTTKNPQATDGFISATEATDKATAHLAVKSVSAVNVATNSVSDTDPERVDVNIDAEEGSTVTVEIKSADGQSKKKVTEQITSSTGTAATAAQNDLGDSVNVRNHTIKITEDSFTLEATDKVVVTISKDTRINNTGEKVVGEVATFDNDTSVTGWANNPVTVKHDPTTGAVEAEVAVPDATETDVDSFTIQFHKQSEATNPVEVTYTKSNGDWTTTDAKGTTLEDGKVKIPASVLNGDTGEKIKVKATDIAGNKTGEEAKQHYVHETNAADLPKTAQPTAAPTVAVQDLDREADDTVEKVFITGTGAPANSEVFLLNAQGQRVQNATGQDIKTNAGQDGGYSFTLTKQEAASGEHKVNSIDTAYKVQALEANHSPSDPVDVTIPATVARGTPATKEQLHPNDTTNPANVSVAQDAQNEENLVVSVPADGVKKGDRLVIKDMDQNLSGTGTELGTFDFDGTKWTPVGSPTVGLPTKSGDNWTVNVSASGNIESGDYIKAELQDYAGNSTTQSAQMPNVDPDHIDPVKIWVGSTTKEATDSTNPDPRKAERLKVDTATNVNAGEVYIEPGADNTTVFISYFNESNQGNQGKHIVAKKDGSAWTFVEGSLNQNTGEITETTTPATGIEAVEVNGKTYFKLAADEVQDYNSVLVSAKDNNSNTVTAEARSDFDDRTENNVTGVDPVQPNATDNISITLGNGQEDVVYYVLSFDASHIQNENDANTLGVNNQSGERNFIVVRKGSDGEWSANFFAGKNGETRNSFDYRSEGESAVPYLQSFNKDTGSIELKKDYVKGSSTVNAKFVDAYGMFAESTLTTKHTPTETPIQVDAPEVKALGNGLMSIVAGEVDYHEQGGQIQPKGTDFKTVVRHNGKTYTIKYNSTSNQYELEEPQDGSTKVSFNSATGKLVISSTSADKVTALAEKMYNNQKYTSGDPVEDTFVLAPPSAEEDKSADPVWIETGLNGNIKVHIGEDNVRLVLKMVRQTNTAESVNNEKESTFVFTRSSPTDNWTYAQDDPKNDNDVADIETIFDLGRRDLILPHESVTKIGSHVKDATKVTATVFDANGNEASDVKYSLVDDDSEGGTGKPSITPNSEGVGAVIKPYKDQHIMFITIQPPRPQPENIWDLTEQPLPEKQHMVLRLENDTWTLKYYDPVNNKELGPVPSVVAELDYEGFQGNKRPKVKVKEEYLSSEDGNNQIVAKGVDNYGHQDTYSVEYSNDNAGFGDSDDGAQGNSKPTKTPQVTFANGSDTAEGSVTITPQPEHNRLTVEYINEKDLLVNAILVKEGSGWKLAKLSEAGKPSDFDFSNGIRLNANALKDRQPNGLKVVAQAEGKLNSDSAVHTPEKNYVAQTPPQPPVPEVLTGLGDKLNGTTNTVKVSNDVTHRVFARAGWNELKKELTDAGLGTMEAPTRSDPYTKIVLKEKGGEGVALNVNGAFGDTTPPEVSGGWNIFGTWTRGVKLTGTAKNDIIVTATDFGEDEVNAREHSMNLGNGHDVLIVGGNNPNHKLYENNSGTTPRTRYAFDQAGQGWTEVNYHFEGTQSDQGGVLNKAKIEMGEGNDLIAIEGMNRRVQPAVDRSLVDLGAGDDSLIIAHTNEQNMSNKRHSLKSYNIADDSTVRTGAGNDYIKAGGISGNAKVYMEGDNDTVELLRMYDGGSVLDMGAGDDILIITSEVRDFARINLGDGNDVFQFGGGISKLHTFGRDALFQGELEGGRGYDILVVKSPQAATNILNSSLAETNMSTSRFKGIEEVQLEKGTVLDIKYNDLLRDGVDGPLKVKMAGTTGQNDRKVDLGGTDPNSNSGPNPNLTDGNKTWVKSGTETENGVTYDVYSINGDINNSVWIQQGILVI